MKQPELGKKISELRKEKGLTQEELVEVCNINVRTIQRIEAGEVTPRSYTLKTILKALDYDLVEIQTEEKNKISFGKTDFVLINIAFWVGILFVIVDSFNLFLNFTLDFGVSVFESITLFKMVYFFVQIASFLLAIAFYLGFFISGKVLTNTLLKVTAILMLVVSCCNYFFSWFLMDSNDFIVTSFGVVSLLFYGAVGIPFGIGILKLNKHIGYYATITGIFTIILYATMITVILIFMSVFLLLPVMILQLILLYRIKEYLQKA